MRGSFDNEIKAAIYQQKNAKAAETPTKGKGGKKFGAQKAVASSAAKGGKQSINTRVPSNAEEIAEGEQPISNGRMKPMARKFGG